jgi:Leucine-rich repeat (LRR) protein
MAALSRDTWSSVSDYLYVHERLNCMQSGAWLYDLCVDPMAWTSVIFDAGHWSYDLMLSVDLMPCWSAVRTFVYPHGYHDYTPLIRYMPNLEHLHITLRHTPANDWLMGLSRLRTLHIYGRALHSCESLIQLEALEELTLVNTSAMDLAWVAHLPRLRTIHTDVYDSDVSALPSDLQELTVRKLLPVPPSIFANLHGLRLLNISDSRSANLFPLAAMCGLECLYLDRCNDVDLQVISQLRSLRVLSMKEARCTQMRSLTSLVNLEELYLSRMDLEDPTMFANLPRLRILDLSYTMLRTLDTMHSLVALEELYLIHVPIQSLVPLSSLDKLRVLNVTGTDIREVAPISWLTTLEVVKVGYTHVTDLVTLQRLPRLRLLMSEGTPPQNKRKT